MACRYRLICRSNSPKTSNNPNKLVVSTKSDEEREKEAEKKGEKKGRQRSREPDLDQSNVLANNVEWLSQLHGSGFVIDQAVIRSLEEELQAAQERESATVSTGDSTGETHPRSFLKKMQTLKNVLDILDIGISNVSI